MGGAEKGKAIISAVRPGSIGAEVGLEPGDVILSIDGHKLRDVIDYHYLASAESLVLLARKVNGDELEIEVEKDSSEELGVYFDTATFDGMRRCANKCTFCFIDQNPPGLRSSIYVRDDDYRLSFLQGHFVTLTNLQKRDWERIVRLRLSPLYVSVHTTDPDLRQAMMGTPAARHIGEQLKYLSDHNIKMHVQIVLCPGVNDGAALARTLSDLAALYPAVISVAVVPVGITRFRTALTPMRSFTKDEVLALANTITHKQHEYLQAFGTRFVWLADEFYLGYNLPLPAISSYEDIPQADNGVGLAVKFTTEFKQALGAASERRVRSQPISIASGRLGACVLAPAVRELCNRGADVTLWTVPNKFFGESVTATGLVTGSDLIAALQHRKLGSELLIPQVMVRDTFRGEKFLDDISVDTLSHELGVPVTVLANAQAIVQHFFS